MTEREALKLALEALETLTEGHSLGGKKLGVEAITAIKEALAQPEQEPVAHMYPCDLKEFKSKEMCAYAYSIEYVSASKGETIPLYTTPPQRTWVGLTDEEMFKTWLTVPAETEDRLAFGRAVEAKLKEKNT